MDENENATSENAAPENAEGIADDEKPEGIAEGDEGESELSENKQATKEDGGADGKEGEKKEAEDYELAAPENFPLPEENLKSFGDAAKKLGLTKEQAEGMLAWHKEFHEEAQAANEAAMTRQIADWQKEMAKDPEFGGARARETLAASRKALRTFDVDGSLRKFLRETGQQFNPTVIRAIARVGNAMGEHGFVNGSGGVKKPLHERMYPEMGK